MSELGHFVLFTRYNRWMNEKIYDCAATLPPEEIAKDRSAFFGSILGTLNHLVVTDMLWMKRMISHPASALVREELEALEQPTALNQILETDLAALRARRDRMDDLIARFVAGLGEKDLATAFSYRRTNGEAQHKLLGDVLLHVFNHQTHHRGQLTTLLSQAGKDVGVTDILMLLPDAD
ncbi:DinB family protein [Hartmannibacter diazotrophicus]|uniref:DinB family protein n=1 Tax=Hartmannibacter diazotrophicus TaxID=1482074 RepID=A0A2C9DBP4_9HYPH|nr:DinB family protein [Hartmannibacter diazotrophicus]SON57590.1 DinB family protein [Hartmannibacter diazotrophicus]